MKTLNICPSFTQNIINATLAKKKNKSSWKAVSEKEVGVQEVY